MKRLTKSEFVEVLRLHSLWLDGASCGVRADLSGANLTEADLSGTNLSGANLSNSNLSWANLTEADLAEANLSWANLSWATLSEADLTEADLTEADLTEADLTDANLSGVTLHTAIGDGVRIRTTKTEKYTINHYDDRCQIGCKNHTLEEWAAFTDDEIADMDDGALDWWRRWRKFVLTEQGGEE